MKYAPLSNLLIYVSINNENHFMALSDYIWKNCPDTVISTGANIIFYQGGTIDHGTHVLGTVFQSSAESEDNAALNAGMALSNFKMLINGFLNKDLDIVPEVAALIILDSKYDVCMYKNGKDTNHTRTMVRRVHLSRNGGNSKV